MSKQSRRDFFKHSAALALTASAIGSDKTQAQDKFTLSKERMGVLVDTTVCIGCRKCEWACKTAHFLPAGDIQDYDDKNVFDKRRRPDHTALTVINKYEDTGNPDNSTTVKVQCMHCEIPACESACIVGALKKMENGAVVWDTDKCIGCRYCMVACPFQIPAFEYHKALDPRIMKCDFCFSRTNEGKLPACVEICPVEALTYGNRTELIRVAENRIRNYPERYIDHIYGEGEVGGTSWIYLAGKEFKELEFPALGNIPAPGVSESIQHGIFAYFVPPIALYALLGGIMWLNKENKNNDQA